jgi:hypothetical protein
LVQRSIRMVRRILDGVAANACAKSGIRLLLGKRWNYRVEDIDVRSGFGRALRDCEVARAGISFGKL